MKRAAAYARVSSDIQVNTIVSSMQGKIQNAIEAVLKESSLAKQLKKEARKLQNELFDVEKELKKLKNGGTIYVIAEELKKKYNEYKERLNGVFSSKRSLILELIDKVIVYKHGYIKVEAI